MKKISVLLILLLIISLSLIGCGGGDKKTVTTDENTPVSDTTPQSTVELGDGSRVDLGKWESGNNMEMPVEFPVDILPVLDDAQINHIIKNDTNKGINITFTTGKSLKEAGEFYKEVMKDGRDTQVISGEDSYIIMGVKGDYVVAISIVLTQGDTYVNIDARPQVQ